MDAAWALIMRQTPMMANPFEYRETLWDLLWEGERPAVKQVGGDSKPARRPKASLTTGDGGLSRRDSENLNAMRDELMELRARKERERASLPPPPATS